MSSVIQLEQMEAIYQSAPIGLCVLDRDLRYVCVNDRLAELNGVPVSEHIGRTVREVLPSLEPEAEVVLRQVIDLGTPLANLEVQNGPRTGVLHCAPLRHDGQVIGINIAVEDITSRKRMEEQLREREEELIQADRLKDDFLALLGHELRNPLAPILTAAQILKARCPQQPPLQNAIDTIVRQTRQVSALVDDLLDIGRITAGKLRLEKKPVALHTVLAQAIETCAPLIEQRRHTIDVAVPKATIVVDADAGRLVQVVCNLLNNAAKYMDEGGHIDLAAAQENDTAVIRVRDRGIGIPPEMLGRIFERFVQVGTTGNHAEGGLGMGLALVKWIVERHGGRVEAHSAGLGQGSEFVVRLPVASPPVSSRSV